MRSRNNTTRRAGRLRIVAGKWRNRRLEIADVAGLRPTSERIRETLFNWLTPDLPGSRCLDLFAGTGALGLEALSRDAGSADFVEASRAAVRTLTSNIRLLGSANAKVHAVDARDFVENYRGEPFDIVFLDPPFAAAADDELCRLVSASSLLARKAQVYLEQPRERELAELPSGWTVKKSKTAGGVRYSLFSVSR